MRCLSSCNIILIWICSLSNLLFVPVVSFQRSAGLLPFRAYPTTTSRGLRCATSPDSTSAVPFSSSFRDNTSNEGKQVHKNQPLKRQSGADDPNNGYGKEYQILAFFLLLFSFNQLCRQLIYYFSDFTSITDPRNVNPFQFMNQDLEFSKDQYATVASFGFTTFFVLASFIAGVAADRFSRTDVIALSCLVWSVITCLQGRVDSFSQLLPLRGALGVSQAFLNPAVYSLIAEIFPKNLIGTATGIYSGGIYIGGGLASLSILLDKFIGWRSSFIAIGLAGIVLSILAKILVPEPRKVIVADTVKSGEVWTVTGSLLKYFNDVTEILSIEQVQTLFIASMFRFAAGFTIAVWKAPFVFQQFPNFQDYFAGSNAAIITFGGLLSTFLGGWLSDFISKESNETNDRGGQENEKEKISSTKKKRYSRSWIPAIGSLLAVPTWFGFMTIDQPSLAFTCLLFEYIVAECWFGPTLASIFQVIPANKKGTAQSLFAILTAIGNIGPNVVTFLMGSQFAFPGQWTSLQSSLIFVVCFAYLISAGFFLKAAKDDQKKLDFVDFK